MKREFVSSPARRPSAASLGGRLARAPSKRSNLAPLGSSVYARAPMRRAVALVCLRAFGAALMLTLLSAGCAPKIGRNCGNSLDCSLQGSRICDRTQPGGYCTIMGCEVGTCPDEAVCVKFRPSEERLAETFCMAKCSHRSDCRGDEGYHCTTAGDFGRRGDAEILGNPNQKFCAYLIPRAAPEPNMSRPDASSEPNMSSPEDGGEPGDAADLTQI